MEKQLVTTKDLAAMLSVSKPTIHRMIASGKLGPRPLRLGGRAVRWRESEIIAWIRAGCPGRAQWDAMTKEGGSV